jgi:hypothetical protein
MLPVLHRIYSYVVHAAWYELEPRAIEPAIFSLKIAGSRVSLLIHLHARKIISYTVFAVADNVKNNETRGTVFFF